MYIGALMPPNPIKPIKIPWPIHSGHGGPKVEIVRPVPIISEPKMTVERVPIRSAIRDIKMPPIPEPSHATAPASAGMERAPPTSPAMSLSATVVIHAAPNDIPRMTSAAEATTQEALVSTECRGGEGIAGQIQCVSVVQAEAKSATLPGAGLPHMLHCDQFRRRQVCPSRQDDVSSWSKARHRQGVG